MDYDKGMGSRKKSNSDAGVSVGATVRPAQPVQQPTQRPAVSQQSGVQQAVQGRLGSLDPRLGNPYVDFGAEGKGVTRLFDTPGTNMVGGGKGYYDRQMLYWGGIGDSSQMIGQGGSMLGQAYASAGDDRLFGASLLASGLGGQAGALANARRFAAQPTDSLAQLQLQQGLAQNQQAMLGQAAQARGGNQAAAMRQAQLLGTQQALQTNQQAAMMRAAEQQAAINRQIGVEQMAQQAAQQQLGLGMGAMQAGTSNQAQIGSQVGGMGLQQQGQMLDAMGQTDALQAQFQRDRTEQSIRNQERQGKALGSILGSIPKMIGGAMGGFF